MSTKKKTQAPHIDVDLSLDGDLSLDFKSFDLDGEEDLDPKGRTIAQQANDEIEDLKLELNAYKAARENEIQQYSDITDSEFWFCVCFASREDKATFLQAIGLFEEQDKYVDGYKLAEAFNERMVAVNKNLPVHATGRSRWIALARPPEKLVY